MGVSAKPAGSEGKQLLICCGIGFLCFFGAHMRVPVLPLFAASLGADTTQVGLINAAFMLSAGVLSIPFGLLSDRVGQRPLLVAGLLIIAGSTLLLPFSSGPLPMGSVYLLSGVGMAAFTPTMMLFVANISPIEHLGRAYSLYTTAVYLGLTFGPAAGGLLGRIFGLGKVFWFSGGTVLLALPFLLLFMAKGDAPPFPGGERRPVWQTVTVLLKNRRLAACLLATVGGCFGFGMFVTFLPLYAKTNGLNAGHVGIIFAMQALTNVLLRIPFGRLSDRVNRGVMAACGLTLLAVALTTTGFCSSLASLMAIATVVGVGMGISFTVIGTLVAEVVSREQRGLSLGMYNSCIYLGMMLSSAIMGGVIHRVGFGWGFAFAGGGTLLATALFLAGLNAAKASSPENKSP